MARLPRPDYAGAEVPMSASAPAAMAVPPPAEGLKRRVREGAALHVPYVSLDEPSLEVERRYRERRCDLAFIDLQHAPGSDRELVAFCARSTALGVPVQVRIRHPREAYLCGRYCDLGALSVLVPLVEDPETVREAIDAFYYPPLGRRSWGPGNAYRADGIADADYAGWWNRNGVLAIQIESATAALRARDLALRGVDLVLFGGADLALDLGARRDSFLSVEAAIAHATRALRGSGVRVVPTPSPIGDLPAAEPT